jgi:chromosome partitioning protein
MILVCGGIKGGVGKTTIATNLAVMRSLDGKDVLLVDADSQGTASGFAAVRNELLTKGAGFTTIKLSGNAVKTDVRRLMDKHDDVIIDVGGTDSVAQRAALLIADLYIAPFRPSSFDLWAIEDTESLIADAKSFNEQLRAICILNMADSQGKENVEAAELVMTMTNLVFQATPIGNRKAFRNAASSGMSVVETKPKDDKAIAEIKALYKSIYLV